MMDNPRIDKVNEKVARVIWGGLVYRIAHTTDEDGVVRSVAFSLEEPEGVRWGVTTVMPRTVHMDIHE